MDAFTLAVLTALIWGCVPLIEKLGLARMTPMVGLFYRCLGVLLGMMILLIFHGKAIKDSMSIYHPGMFYLIFAGFIASVVGQIFFYYALKVGEASRIVPIAATYPLVSFLLGVILLGEKFSLAKCGGMAFVLLGVFLLK